MLLAAWGFWIETGLLVVNKVSVKVAGWPEDLRGYKIAILADIHAGAPNIDEKKLQTVVEKVNNQHPDLIILLGDYVIHGVRGGKFMSPETMMNPLKNLKAKNGVIAILGNHDWWYNGYEVWNALSEEGFYVLENDYIPMPVNNSAFIVAGLADPDTRNPDTKSFVDVLPEGKPIILLTHSPDVFPQVSDKISLTLAGHTHGGQIRIPFYGAIAVPSKYKNRYAKGLVTEEGRKIFVSSGIGTSILPVRVFCPPEIVIMTVNPE